jgi:NADH dehydrogenase FAD-containing subunit
MKVFDNIFAIGDCCLTKLNEEKTVQPAKICAEMCAKNIRLLAQGDKDHLKALPTRFPCIYGITLGKDKGMFIFNDYADVSKTAADEKLEYQTNYVGAFKGSVRNKKTIAKKQRDLNCMMCFFTPICGCFPCAREPTRTKRPYVQNEVVLNPE